ncbi:MAG TPA: hypothetical protein VLV78_19130 [Thermoanaerobaculia bacterium]|nr:hypothetical protein [Thermoanaerobaculia bacterium]
MRRKPVQYFFAICILAAAMPAFAANKARVYNDATRLAVLLNDAQTTITVSSDVWRVVANEANSLANRIYGATGGNATARGAARDARTHVRAFRDAALAGDAAGARTHATEAMTYVTKLIDWSAPKKN